MLICLSTALCAARAACVQFAQIADGQPQKGERKRKKEGEGKTETQARQRLTDCLYVCNVCRVSIKQLVDYYLNRPRRGRVGPRRSRAGGGELHTWLCRIDN